MNNSYQEAGNYLHTNLETVCAYLFPQGQRNRNNFLVGDITGNPGRSFSIALEPASKRGSYKDFATGTPASRNLVKLWKIVRGIPEDNHDRFFADLIAFSGQTFGWNGQSGSSWQDWTACVAQLSEADMQRLAGHPKRQYKLATVQWMHAQGHLGLYHGHITFAMQNEAGEIVGVHRWIASESKLKFLKSPTLLVFGDPARAKILHVHESVWDLVAMIDRTSWHLDPNILCFCTSGAVNGKLVSGRIPMQIEKIYLWEHRDSPDPKTGKVPNKIWQAKVAQIAFAEIPNVKVHLVAIPETSGCKDLNDWTVLGATKEQIGYACDFAGLYQSQADAVQQLKEEELKEKEAKEREEQTRRVAADLDAYYDCVRKEYPLRDYTAVYQSFTETQFKRALRFRNLSSQIIEKRSWSQTDIVIRHLQQHHYVNYVGALAGHDCGYYEENGIPILVTSSPKLIQPVKGNWDTLSNFLTGLLWDPDEAYGDEQQIVTYGWLQTAYNAFRVRKFQPGQAFAMAGPIEAGKSLWQSLITEIIGGRSAKAALFLQGRTNFNGELFEAEHLLLEDEAASTDHRARMALGTAIKNLIANRIHSCNPKHRQIVNLRPWWRLSVSLNDREERLLVLPPLTEDIADKIILLRATVHPMPMPADTAEEKEAFWKQLCAELPALLYYLVHEFVIPADWRNTRFGIRSWQHPSLLSALEELSQPIALLELIDRADIWSRQYSDSNGQLATFKTVPWEGTALELRTKLLANPLTKRDAERLLDWTNATGQYLNDLARIRQTRVKFHRDQSRRWYEIFPP